MSACAAPQRSAQCIDPAHGGVHVVCAVGVSYVIGGVEAVELDQIGRVRTMGYGEVGIGE